MDSPSLPISHTSACTNFSKVLHLNLRVVESEKALLEAHEQTVGEEWEISWGELIKRAPKYKLPKHRAQVWAENTGGSRGGGQHPPSLKMRENGTENQLNASLSPWPVPQPQSCPAPLSLYLWMEKHLGRFALLLIPPGNLHICLERSSKYNFQGNPNISKFSLCRNPQGPEVTLPWALLTLF